MKSIKHIGTFAAVAALAAAGVTATAFARDDDGRVRSDMMVGVPAAMTGAAGNIRGVNGGGIAWAIGESEASVKSSGKVEVEFEDLVFAAGPNVGKNTVASMAVVVSCLNGLNQPVNVRSAPFPVTVATETDPGGDAEVETTLDLPSPCFAPIVFVTNATGAAWFAVDGF